jgi:hypothetical protein
VASFILLLIGGMSLMATAKFGGTAKTYGVGPWFVFVMLTPTIVYLIYLGILWWTCIAQHHQCHRSMQLQTPPAPRNSGMTLPQPGGFHVSPFIGTTSLPAIDTIILPKRAPLEMKLPADASMPNDQMFLRCFAFFSGLDCPP